nr:aldA [Aeromicrobium sp.]
MNAPARPTVQSSYGLFIGGEWVEGTGGSLDAFDPSTGAKFSSFSDASAADVARAVAAADVAFTRWGRSSWGQRAAVLTAIADRIEANAAHLAAVESLDAGKPIRQATTWDLPVAVESFRYFAAAARLQKGETTTPSSSSLNFEIREPLGPVAQIVPWNGSILMLGWKLAPALAAGCTIVVKPSEQASIVALEVVKAIADLVPPGVINLVTGGAEAGTALTSSPGIKRISFTGSGAVGRQVMRSASEHFTPVTLELGGKSPNIVMPDADVTGAALGACLAIVPNQGQMCVAGSRLMVHESIYDAFVEQLREKMAAFRFGDALDPRTDMGPLISAGHAARVAGFRDRAVAEGGKEIIAVEVPSEVAASGGYFGALAAIEVEEGMELATQEVFGPLLAVSRWSDEADLVRQANSTEYALGAGVWGQDLTAVMNLVRSLRTGIAWVNTYGALPVGASFGGVGASGFGRDNSIETMHDYQYVKSVIVNLRGRPMPMY